MPRFAVFKHFTMKKLLFLLPILAILSAACSNEFEVAAPWEEIPVAYGIISPADTAHYIRVEKAFLDPETSAFTVAQIADSLYYPENAISVFLQRVNGGQFYQMQRVDGSQEGYPRKGGIFATQPNWLYKYKFGALDSLRKGEKYRLVIKRADGKPDITAETTIPRDYIFVDPKPFQDPRFIKFIPDETTNVEWRGDINAEYLNVNFRIRYREEYPDGTVVLDTLDWLAAKNVQRGDQQVSGGLYVGATTISGIGFYQFLKDNIPVEANPPKRYFLGIDFVLTGGGREIREYLEAAAANSGITGAEVFPTYTNLSEGFGIFTGKNTGILRNITLTTKTIEEVGKNPLTSGLNFQL